MNRSNIANSRPLGLIVGCVLIFFSAILFLESHARSQTDDGTRVSGIWFGPAIQPSAGFGAFRGHTSGQQAERDRIRYDIRQGEGSLRIEKDTLLRALPLAEKISEKLLAAASGDQTGGIPIDKVKRVVGGRSGGKDTMVSVAELRAVWKQMDYILDKMDEITERLSTGR